MTRPAFRLGAAILLSSLLGTALAPGRGSARSQIVPDDLTQKAWTAGSIRVIVRLSPDLGGDDDAISPAHLAIRRQNIAAAQRAVRSGLNDSDHRVIHQYDSLPFLALEVDSHALRSLEALTGIVAAVEEDRLAEPVLAESGPLVQADQAWAAGFDGTGTVIAILDTGIDTSHSFLSGKIVAEACFSSNNAALGASSLCPGGVTSSTAPGSGASCSPTIASCSHGTHVAGIAAGAGPSFSGVARGARLVSIEVFSRFDNPDICGSSSPCVRSFTSDQLAALNHVYNLRATYNFAAINMSLGGGGATAPCDEDPTKVVVDRLRTAGIATVIASGNNGYTNALSAPACISTAVSVGSTEDGSFGTVADRISSFSNTASFLSLLAPGQWITSSVPGGFATWAGTSMAAPHVAGAFAVLKQAAPAASVTDLLTALRQTGAPVTDPGNGLTFPRIRLLEAIDAFATPGAVEFSSAAYAVDESAGSATITVIRSGSLAGTATVRYATSNGSALAGADYGARSGTLTFGPGRASQTFTVPIVNDTLAEGDETVNLALSGPAGGVTLGARAAAVLTIRDNDVAGTVQFSAAAYSVAEGGRTATITVRRTAGTASGVTVDYATVPGGSATAGADYVSKTGTLTFNAGETTKTFTVQILNDTLTEGPETVNLALRSLRGGAVPGLSTAVLTIGDNDPSGLRFSAATYRVSEGGTVATITVTRTGATSSPATVAYATSGGTATGGPGPAPGVDYITTSGTLTFLPGQRSRAFTIPIVNDTTREAAKTVNLSLSSPTGFTTLGTPGTAVLTIADND